MHGCVHFSVNVSAHSCDFFVTDWVMGRHVEAVVDMECSGVGTLALLAGSSNPSESSSDPFVSGSCPFVCPFADKPYLLAGTDG